MIVDYLISLYYSAQYWYRRWQEKPPKIEKAEYTYLNSCAWKEHNYLVDKINEVIDRINGQNH